MSSVAIGERSPVALRPLALPAEHGGWGLVLEPIVLALLVAPSAAGLLISLGAVAAFLMRHPLKLAARDWLQRRRYPRSSICELLAVAYCFTACVAFAAAWTMTTALPLLVLTIALPFAAIQLSRDVRNRSRKLSAEISGAIVAAPIAAAIALAGGKPIAAAIALSALMIARSVPAILYVRATLRNERRGVMLVAHAMAIAVGALSSWIAVMAMSILFGRALPRVNGVRAQTIGLREIGWGALTVLLIALSFRAP